MKHTKVILFSILGSVGHRSNGNNHSDDGHSLQKTSSMENSDVYALIDSMRSKWMSSTESNRLNYLDRFKASCDKHFQTLHSQHSSTNDTQLFRSLYAFFTSILDLLSYITSSNLDLSIKIKLVLSTCLGWLIKHAQGNYCKKHYKSICNIFKNILLNGQSNNRQLAVGDFPCFPFGKILFP